MPHTLRTGSVARTLCGRPADLSLVPWAAPKWGGAHVRRTGTLPPIPTALLLSRRAADPCTSVVQRKLSRATEIYGVLIVTISVVLTESSASTSAVSTPSPPTTLSATALQTLPPYPSKLEDHDSR